MFEIVHTALAAVSAQDQPRRALEELVGELSRVEAHAVERRLAMTAAIDALADGGLKGEDVTRVKARKSARRSKKAAKTATALTKMPKTRAALAKGEINEEHAEAAAEAAERVSPEEADELVEDAASRPADLFARDSRKWAGARERDEAKKDRQARLRAAREVTVWTNGDGMWCLFAKLDPEAGQEISKALGERVDELWRADGGRDGRPDEIRTPEQRRADALQSLMTARPASGASKRPHPRHLVVVGADSSRFGEEPWGEASFVDGTPLPQSTLERIACGADFVGAVFGAKGETLWQGHRVRTATDAQWTNLIARDGGCFCCSADPSHCQAHHVVPWVPSRGPTDIDNLALVCTRTHHLIHDHGYRMVWVDGKWTLAPPQASRRAA